MSTGEALLVLDFRSIDDTDARHPRLSAHRQVIYPNTDPDTFWVSFNAIRKARGFKRVGFVYVLPSAMTQEPVDEFAEIPHRGKMLWSDTYGFDTDCLVVAVALPHGYYCKTFDPFPNQAKLLRDGRIAVFYPELPGEVTLTWELDKLADNMTAMMEVQKINAHGHAAANSQGLGRGREQQPEAGAARTEKEGGPGQHSEPATTSNSRVLKDNPERDLGYGATLLNVLDRAVRAGRLPRHTSGV